MPSEAFGREGISRAVRPDGVPMAKRVACTAKDSGVAKPGAFAESRCFCDEDRQRRAQLMFLSDTYPRERMSRSNSGKPLHPRRFTTSNAIFLDVYELNFGSKSLASASKTSRTGCVNLPSSQ